VIYAGPVFTDSFVQKFSDRYKEYPEFASGNAYDIIQIYARDLPAGACTAEAMRTFIAGIKEFHGALGTYGVTDGNDFRFPVQPKTIQGGKFKFL